MNWNPWRRLKKMTQHKWPNTDPIDKTKPFWECNNNLNVNGIQYKKAEISPGRWQWVIDEEIMRYKAERQQHQDDLVWALRTRVLSDDEMAEVRQYGIHLLTREMVPYTETDIARQFNDLLLQQFALRHPPP